MDNLVYFAKAVVVKIHSCVCARNFTNGACITAMT